MSSSSSTASDDGSASSADSALGTQVTTQPLPSSQVQLINIKSHITVVLELHDSNYGQWSRSFTVLLAKFGLTDHIDGSTPRGDSEWVQNDFAIVSWVYATVSLEILQIVQTKQDTAYKIWRAVRALFRDNKEARSIYVSAEFRTLYQGDMPVLAYCTKMKTLADTLGDLGAPVAESDLVLNILCGLNPRLHSVIPTITMHPPLPSFLKVRSSLMLEELRVSNSTRLAEHAAYMAKAPQSVPSLALPPPSYFGLAAQAPSSSSGPAPTSTPSSAKKFKPKKKNTGNSNTSAPRTAPSPTPVSNPWAGIFQAWSMGRTPTPAAAPASGLLGPRPGSNSYPQQAFQVSPTPAPQQPSWDQASLIQALNAMSTAPSSAGPSEWVVDTGASSHMSSQPGSQNQGGDSAL